MQPVEVLPEDMKFPLRTSLVVMGALLLLFGVTSFAGFIGGAAAALGWTGAASTQLTVTMAVGPALWFAAALLISPRWGSLTFAAAFIILGSILALTVIYGSLASGGYSSISMGWATSVLVPAVGMFAVYKGVALYEDHHPRLFYSAVRVETSPSGVVVQGQNGVEWGTSSGGEDHPFIRYVIQEQGYADPGVKDMTITAIKNGYKQETHSWGARFWRSEWRARRNEERVYVQLKPAYDLG